MLSDMIPVQRRLNGAAVLALTLMMMTGALVPAVAQDAPKPEVSTIRYLGMGGDLNPFELADALGYLKPLKLERLGDVDSGPAALQTVATDQIDAALSFNGSVLSAVAAGAPLTAVVSWRGTSQETSDGLFTLEGSDIKAARDLIGKKVGLNTLGANAEAVLDIYLAKGGLTQDEIKQVTLVTLPMGGLEQALRNKQVAAVSLRGIFRDSALGRGGLSTLYRNYDLLGAYSDNTVVVRSDFATKNPDTVKLLVSGIAKAIEWEHAREGEKERPEVIDLFRKYLESTGRSGQTNNLKYWRASGVATEGGWIRKQEFQMWLDWLSARGDVDPTTIDFTKLYTNAFNPYWKGQEN